MAPCNECTPNEGAAANAPKPVSPGPLAKTLLPNGAAQRFELETATKSVTNIDVAAKWAMGEETIGSKDVAPAEDIWEEVLPARRPLGRKSTPWAALPPPGDGDDEEGGRPLAGHGEEAVRQSILTRFMLPVEDVSLLAGSGGHLPAAAATRGRRRRNTPWTSREDADEEEEEEEVTASTAHRARKGSAPRAPPVGDAMPLPDCEGSEDGDGQGDSRSKKATDSRPAVQVAGTKTKRASFFLRGKSKEPPSSSSAATAAGAVADAETVIRCRNRKNTPWGTVGGA